MSSVTPQLDLPILLVDHAHWQRSVDGGVEPSEYTISTHQGFILSTQGYEFTIPEMVGFHHPNIIQMILGKEQLYAMAYEEGISEYAVTPGNLVAMYGSPPFTGFTSGQKVIIAVGHLTPAGEENPQPKFVVLWAGVVNIK
ncbi:MAG: hypothetical protein AB9897_00345 [Anaerolineaceae bacterium]